MHLPQLLALIMIVTTMLGAGLQVDRQRLLEALRDYGLLSRALLANFVLVPLFAALLVRVFRVDSSVSIGILLMAMAPGVPFLVNSAARKEGGSLAFALEVAFLFSALSVITIPITASLLFPPEALTQVPAAKFLTTLLAFQLVPLVLGAFIAPRLEARLIERLEKGLHLVFLVAVLALLVAVFPKVIASVSAVFGFGRLAIIGAVGLFSIATGWFLGGPNRQYRRTLAVATLIRNIGLCALIATGSFAGTLVVPTVISYFVITFALSLPIRAYFSRTKDASLIAAGA